MNTLIQPRNRVLPAVNTSALPDIVFMLLFFFMTVTVMKEDPIKVENVLPISSQTKKMEKRDRLIYIYVGKPISGALHPQASTAAVQMNDKFIRVEEVGQRVLEQINIKPSHIRPLVSIALKIDKKADMGLVNDIKEELRKVNALRIYYVATEEAGKIP